MLRRNILKERQWHHGLPYEWWQGMSSSEFIGELPKHLDMKKEPEWFYTYKGRIKIVRPFDAKKDADKILADFDDAATALGIKHFLYAGTCLGFVRDGNYIPGDNDIDVGILCDKKVEHQLYIKLYEKQFERYKRFIKFFVRDHIVLDIFYTFYPEVLTCLKKLGTIEYGSRKYFVPHPVEKYLVYAYGDSWRIPDGGFMEFMRDPVTSRRTQVWKRHAVFSLGIYEEKIEKMREALRTASPAKKEEYTKNIDIFTARMKRIRDELEKWF